MASRCPPGVLCIENITIIYIIILIVGIVSYYMYSKNNTNSIFTNTNPSIIIEKEIINRGIVPKFNYGTSNQVGDVLLNPYEAPLKNSGFFTPTGDVRGGVPINVRTQGYSTNYSQVGILTRKNGSETILPLMGRALHTNRNKWQYYTMSDKNNSVKLPVSKNGRSATQEYGVDELYNGDVVYVEGYNDAFKVTIYDNNQPQYIPYL
jgi:hypothetical protein